MAEGGWYLDLPCSDDTYTPSPLYPQSYEYAAEVVASANAADAGEGGSDAYTGWRLSRSPIACTTEGTRCNLHPGCGSAVSAAPHRS